MEDATVCPTECPMSTYSESRVTAFFRKVRRSILSSGRVRQAAPSQPELFEQPLEIPRRISINRDTRSLESLHRPLDSTLPEQLELEQHVTTPSSDLPIGIFKTPTPAHSCAAMDFLNVPEHIRQNESFSSLIRDVCVLQAYRLSLRHGIAHRLRLVESGDPRDLGDAQVLREELQKADVTLQEVADMIDALKALIVKLSTPDASLGEEAVHIEGDLGV